MEEAAAASPSAAACVYRDWVGSTRQWAGREASHVVHGPAGRHVLGAKGGQARARTQVVSDVGCCRAASRRRHPRVHHSLGRCGACCCDICALWPLLKQCMNQTKVRRLRLDGLIEMRGGRVVRETGRVHLLMVWFGGLENGSAGNPSADDHAQHHRHL